MQYCCSRCYCCVPGTYAYLVLDDIARDERVIMRGQKDENGLSCLTSLEYAIVTGQCTNNKKYRLNICPQAAYL